ncbi:4-hydroxythreonine-4-phosphate dehydrogenase PdxA [Balneola sp. MJW-20]|uniref:4-hydroxythreonine-4-phosphate dehydrogenase PdxA n=1 Tax=Gracilimonas aurantiaca TaxID=3234185 RepID=UPI0034651287
MPPIIGITIGDVNGIGPELILKTISSLDSNEQVPLIIGPVQALKKYETLVSGEWNYNIIQDVSDIKYGKVNILDDGTEEVVITPGIQSSDGGKIAMNSIERTIELCISRKIDAMVTSPISKEAVNLAGYEIPGHTEFLADKTDTSEVLMMLVNEGLRVALVSTHVPISAVANEITKERIIRKAQILDRSLRTDFRISEPKIAVFGLNPHAGDGGVIGEEEITIINPAMEEIKRIGINAEGPFPADGFFGQKLHEKFDAILAMYHDQGLVPFKLLSFGSGVNFTAGLPIIRTSPDHGTAFNIAGKGVADPSSFLKAFSLAVELVKNNDKADVS